MDTNLNIYKFSKYNHKITLDKDLFLYNALSGGFCKVDHDLQDIFDNCDLLSNVNEISNLPLNIIEELIKGGFLVNKDLDEFKLIKSMHNMTRFANSNTLSLTLIPTMGCNFRCTYCFEKDTNYPNNKMTDDVMDAIIKFIDDNLNDDGHLSISWFGGEPLVNLNMVRNLQTKINTLVDKKHLKLHAGIVTNGYLLTKEVSDELADLRISTIQVTIDGPKELHDIKRCLANGQGTFDKIISNIINMNKNLLMTVRINIEKDNISSMPKFMDFINECGIGKMKNVYFYFAIVRDTAIKKDSISKLCYDIKDFSEEEIELYKMAYEKGINIGQRIKPNFSSCAALSPNGFVIEPDGSLKKCYNTVGEKDKIVGHILDSNLNQDLVTKNQSEWYSWSQFEKDECKECRVLPLCMGGCPYYTLNENLSDLYKKSNYKCITYKYNLENTLKLIAYRHINKLANK